MIAKWLAVAATMALGAFGTLCPAYGQSLYFLYSNRVYSTLTVPDSIFTQAFAIPRLIGNAKSSCQAG